MSEFQKDIPILQGVVNGVWVKENRLSELKTELAAVERKIQLSLTPEPNELENTKQLTADEIKDTQEKAPLRIRAM